MDRAAAPQPGPAAVVFRDGLGVRRHVVDPTGNDALELLCVRGELAAVPSFEFALRERVSHVASFRHAYYGRVRGVERMTDRDATLAVVSDFAPGIRLSELLIKAEELRLGLDINTALCLIRQLVPAVAMLHEMMRDVAHGAIGPERLIVTPNARLMVMEYVLGAALEQLRYSPERYWSDLRIALPRTAGLARFDQRADVTQIGVVALSLILGRPLRDDEYPARVADVVASTWAVSARGGFEPLPPGLRGWLGRALQLDARNAFSSAIDANAELEKVLGDSEYLAAPSNLESFLARYHAAERGAAASVPAPAAPKPVAKPVLASQSTPALGMPIAAPRTIEPAPVRETPAVQATPARGLPRTEITRTSAAGPGTSQEVAPAAAPPPPAARVIPSLASEPTPRTPSPIAPPAAPRPAPPVPPPTPPMPAPLVSAPRSDLQIQSFADAIETKPAQRPAKTYDAESAPHDVETEQASGGRSKKLAVAAVAILVLAGGGIMAARRFMAPAPADVSTGTLIITTSPAGAQVIVDGQARGASPLTLTLSEGSHNIELKSGQAQRSIPVTITAGKELAQYIELPPPGATSGQLQVRTEPAGARVTVDGVAVGTSPMMVLDLAPGEHTVVLESEAGSVKQSVSIESGMTASLVVPMGNAGGAVAPGWMAVTSPVEVHLFEGDRLIGTSRSERLMVAAGRHEIDIVNEALGYRTTRVVQVPAGKVAAITVEMPKGTIALNAQPWAEVWIDGEKVGETPIGNLPIAIGAHDIVFRHPELGEQHHTAMVTLKDVARLSVDLRKK